MSCKVEPAIWSRDTGQRIRWFDRCQLIITWMSNIKEVHSKPRLHVSVNLLFGVWSPSCATPPSSLGLSRLCSATFEQLLAFGATFCGFSNLEQVLPFRAMFEQIIGLEHISSTKKSTISWKTSIHANFLKAYHVINLLNT